MVKTYISYEECFSGSHDFTDPMSANVNHCRCMAVILSRITYWESLVILRSFNDNIFDMKTDENLLNFDEYLEDMDDNNMINVCLLGR